MGLTFPWILDSREMEEPGKDPTGRSFPCRSLGIEYPRPWSPRQPVEPHAQGPLVQGGNVPPPLLQGGPSSCCICYLPPPPWFTASTCFPPVCERNLGTWDMVLPEPWLGEQGGLASLHAPCFLPSPQRLSHIWRSQYTLLPSLSRSLLSALPSHSWGGLVR